VIADLEIGLRARSEGFDDTRRLVSSDVGKPIPFLYTRVDPLLSRTDGTGLDLDQHLTGTRLRFLHLSDFDVAR
jgi:hypothetical protein